MFLFPRNSELCSVLLSFALTHKVTQTLWKFTRIFEDLKVHFKVKKKKTKDLNESEFEVTRSFSGVTQTQMFELQLQNVIW